MVRQSVQPQVNLLNETGRAIIMFRIQAIWGTQETSAAVRMRSSRLRLMVMSVIKVRGFRKVPLSATGCWR
jgi:hypothetical protein